MSMGQVTHFFAEFADGKNESGAKTLIICDRKFKYYAYSIIILNKVIVKKKNQMHRPLKVNLVFE